MHHAYANDDLYALLGLHAAASLDEVRRAYRKMAMAWHPDRNPAAHAEDTFKRIRFAYDTLRDSARRADYDRRMREQPPSARSSAESGPAPSHHADPGAGDAKESGASEPGAGDPSAQAPNLSRRAPISLHQQLHGGQVRLKVTRSEYCKQCHGSGHSLKPSPCRVCQGSGKVRSPLGLFVFFAAEPVDCPTCQGTGQTHAPCAPCEGSGIQARKTGYLRFVVPPGIAPGASLRVRGHGRRGRPGEAAGDLLVRVEIASHPLFTPEFPDLRLEMPVNVFHWLAGDPLEVPTLGEPVTVPLPDTVQDGAELCLPGQGMLDGATGQRGDLLVTLRVVQPGSYSAAQTAWLADLAQQTADHAAFKAWSGRLREAARSRKTEG